MSTILLPLSVFSLPFFLTLIPAGAEEREFEVPVELDRYNAPDTKMKDQKITVRPYDCRIKEIQPGRTDDDGNALIRFVSEEPKPLVEFILINDLEEDKPEWFTYLHGIYPEPFERESAFEVTGRPVRLAAVRQEELALVLEDSLSNGQTSMISGAVARNLLLPDSAAAASQLPDPLALTDKLSAELHLPASQVAALLGKWEKQVTEAPGNSKLDEKLLVSLVNGDLSKAAEQTMKVEILTGDEKKRFLRVMPDTGRMASTVGLHNAVQKQQPAPEAVPAERNAFREALQKNIDTVSRAVPRRTRPLPSTIKPEDVTRLKPYGKMVGEKVQPR